MKQDKAVLLLEDNKIEAMKVQRAFKKLGIQHPLFVCENGIEGLNWLNAHVDNPPGIILLDLNMPKMNGLEFLKSIKEDERFSFIPVVILTTSKDYEDRKESYELQAAGYMVKPVHYADYLHVIKTIDSYWEKSELPF